MTGRIDRNTGDTFSFFRNDTGEWVRRVSITGPSGNPVDVNDSGQMLVVLDGKVDDNNSSNDTLDAGVVFQGSGTNTLDYAIIFVTVFSDVGSAIDGLCTEVSSTGLPGSWRDGDCYTVPAGAEKTFSFQTNKQFFRVRYTNGSSDQAVFDMQTVFKKTNSKPSSHRINDPIVTEDDATLVKSVVTGESELTGVFENISTYRKALNVNSAWVHRKIVNETFHEHDSAQTTPNGPISEGATSILVDDATGFTSGDNIKLEEGSLQEIGLMTITDITTNTLTLDRPLGNSYTTDANIEKVESNMAVVGTLTTPRIFEIDAPPGTVWQITRLLISIVSTASPDDGKFGGIPALTHGVCLRATTAAGRTAVYGNWKTNGDMKLDMYDVDYSDRAPAGAYGTSGRWTFTKSEVIAEIDGDATPLQKLDILIQDDLSDLIDFKIKAQGRVFSP